MSEDIHKTIEGGFTPKAEERKGCVNYGQRVQNSVFECLITEAQLVGLKATLASIINDTTDSIRLYFLGSNWKRRIEKIGKETSYDPTDALII